MFCLRTWIPVLFFMYLCPDPKLDKVCANRPSSSSVSPLYFVLFVGATYYLNRPCMYCSLILTILLFCLYYFHSNWFESQPGWTRSHTAAELVSSGGNIVQNAAMESASIAASVLNSTAATVISGAVEAAKKKMNVNVEMQTQISAAEWLKELLGKKEWRIPCIDIAVRL